MGSGTRHFGLLCIRYLAAQARQRRRIGMARWEIGIGRLCRVSRSVMVFTVDRSVEDLDTFRFLCQHYRSRICFRLLHFLDTR